MAKIIFKVFFGIMKTIANGLLVLINPLVANLFPNFSTMVYNFNLYINTYFTSALNYFFHILPPNARSLVLLYLTILVSYYTISITLHGILKVYTIIKNIKIW